ncbi:hypothetical protein SAMN05421866_1604 [Chryseobacterium oranimense]|uniref:Uncharacterized protein n=1 Tax=Chryseobacterium oranimense TaxID=421058 RepID=A0A1M5NXS9_9FLAO|nr:hypothetical protein [Chryseobacterium oranimense]SHG94366.1 hypothetical protein SAMN05421866_1604 [Chryseobacterium oranimense]
MKNIRAIAYAVVFGTAIVSCASDTELSEEELKAATEAMRFNTINNLYQWNNWNNPWVNTGMPPGIKPIWFGKDLPSMQMYKLSEEITFGKK